MVSARDLPPLNALRAFEATARLESVSRAARELHVTHGAISRQLRLLEQDLGRTLFERRGRGLVLTADGRRLFEASASAFDTLRTASARLRRAGADDALVLACPGSILARWMIPRLERLRRDLPDLSLHLSASEQMPDPALPGADAVLMLAPPPYPPAWQVHALAPESIGPVLSPHHPSAWRLRGAAADALLAEPLLHTTSRPQAWSDWAGAAGLPVSALRQGQAFEHLFYLLEAAVAGLGIAIAPRQLVADDLAAGRLLAPWGFSTTPAHWILAARTDSADPRLPALAAWLEGELRTDRRSVSPSPAAPH